MTADDCLEKFRWLEDEAREAQANLQSIKMPPTLLLELFAAAKEAQRPPSVPGYPMALAEFDDWLNHGERGLSSNMIVAVITGVTDLPGKPVHASYQLPSDAGDFWRCENLLRAVPDARKHLGMVVAEGPEWAALVEHWDELITLDSDALTLRIRVLIEEVQP